MNTPNADVTCDIIQTYIGQNTSSFASPSAFINTVLYNDPNSPFTIEYLYKYFKTNTTDRNSSFIILSNDYTFAGFWLDSNYFVTPSPGGQVRVNYATYIDSFFPNGYITKAINNTKAIYTFNTGTAYLNGNQFCKQSSTILVYNPNINLYDLHNYWYLELNCRDSNMYFQITAYVNSVDYANNNGTLNIVYSISRIGRNYTDIELIKNSYSYFNFQYIDYYLKLVVNATINVYGKMQNLYIVTDNKDASSDTENFRIKTKEI